MTTYIALLRGINVGGNNKVKMVELKEMLVERGFENPKTLLQSGNVVFQSSTESREELEDRLEEATKEKFEIAPAYYIRTLKEWDDVIAANPFEQMAKDDPSHLMVAFLRDPPDAEELAKVASAIQGPEKLEAGTEHIYITYPDDIGHSKVDRTPGWKNLFGKSTARNWNTVLKLAELAKQVCGSRQ
ncbi:DUF1697 domain-containing protein [bacterium]|nr:MAG: DUF1697 domain-containing protein [bacterium]